MQKQNENAGAVEPMVSWLSSLFDTLKKHLEDLTYWRIVAVVDTPKGQKQVSDTDYFDHEYVDLHCQFEDDWHGHIYLPVGKRYLMIEFNS